MLLPLAGYFLLGVLCGVLLRLLPFAIVLVASTALSALGTWVISNENVLLVAAASAVTLQVGYAVGIVCRSGAYALHKRLTGSDKLANDERPHRHRDNRPP